MTGELCFFQMPSGARCTMPKGHSGDHIASSVRRENIIDAARGDSGVKSVKVKGGNCAVIAVILIGTAIGAGWRAIEAVATIL